MQGPPQIVSTQTQIASTQTAPHQAFQSQRRESASLPWRSLVRQYSEGPTRETKEAGLEMSVAFKRHRVHKAFVRPNRQGQRGAQETDRRLACMHALDTQGRPRAGDAEAVLRVDIPEKLRVGSVHPHRHSQLFSVKVRAKKEQNEQKEIGRNEVLPILLRILRRVPPAANRYACSAAACRARSPH